MANPTRRPYAAFLSSEVSDYPGVDVEQGPEGSIDHRPSMRVDQQNRLRPEAVTARLTTTGGHPTGTCRCSPLTPALGRPGGDTLEYEWDLEARELHGSLDFADEAVHLHRRDQKRPVTVRVKDPDDGKASLPRSPSIRVTRRPN